MIPRNRQKLRLQAQFDEVLPKPLQSPVKLQEFFAATTLDEIAREENEIPGSAAPGESGEIFEELLLDTRPQPFLVVLTLVEIRQMEPSQSVDGRT